MIDFASLFANDHTRIVAITDPQGSTVYHERVFVQIDTLDVGDYQQDIRYRLTCKSDTKIQPDYYVLLDYSGNDANHIITHGKRAITPRKTSPHLWEIDIV